MGRSLGLLPPLIRLTALRLELQFFLLSHLDRFLPNILYYHRCKEK